MILVLPVCFLICFSVELLQTSIFLVYNAKLEQKNASYWDMLLACLFSFLQIGFSTAGIVGVVAQLHSEIDVDWLEVVMMCNIQLSVGINVRSSEKSN
jgi:hypothetical protein